MSIRLRFWLFYISLTTLRIEIICLNRLWGVFLPLMCVYQEQAMLQRPPNSLLYNNCSPGKAKHVCSYHRATWCFIFFPHCALWLWLSRVSRLFHLLFVSGYVWCVRLFCFFVTSAFDRRISPWGSIKCIVSFHLISSHHLSYGLLQENIKNINVGCRWVCPQVANI